jgi:hypothetical protein
MKSFKAGVVGASVALALLPGMAAAQCEGGSTVAGFYLRDGSYVPGHCATTNPTTPGQLYPSGAQPFPSTNPAGGASRLPGQILPSGLLPVNSSDLGPAPSFVSTGPLVGGGISATGPSIGPGAPLVGQGGVGQVLPNTSTGLSSLDTGQLMPGAIGSQQTALVDTTTATGLSGQFPQAGMLAPTDNRAIPSNLAFPNLAALNGAPGPNPGPVTGLTNAPSGVTGLAAGQLGPMANAPINLPATVPSTVASAAAQVVNGPTLAPLPQPPPVPGRGGSTYIGE